MVVTKDKPLDIPENFFEGEEEEIIDETEQNTEKVIALVAIAKERMGNKIGYYLISEYPTPKKFNERRKALKENCVSVQPIPIKTDKEKSKLEFILNQHSGPLHKNNFNAPEVMEKVLEQFEDKNYEPKADPLPY